MKRTPLLMPQIDESANPKITYRRSIPMPDEGKLGDVVVNVNNGDRYVKTPTEWQIVPDSALLRSIDDAILRDSRDVATGKFKKHAIKRACERLLATMRATGTISCHYENGDLCNGWAK